MPTRLRTKDLQTLSRGAGLAGICSLNGRGFPQKNRTYERIAPIQSGKKEWCSDEFGTAYNMNQVVYFKCTVLQPLPNVY